MSDVERRRRLLIAADGNKRAIRTAVYFGIFIAMMITLAGPWSKSLREALSVERVTSWEQLATISPARLLTHKGVGTAALGLLRSEMTKRGLAMVGVFTAPASGVYFLRCAEFVKIGCSLNVDSRVAAIRSHIPVETVIALVLRVDPTLARSTESSLHRRFARLRHRQEWFYERDELAAYIAAGGDA